MSLRISVRSVLGALVTTALFAACAPAGDEAGGQSVDSTTSEGSRTAMIKSGTSAKSYAESALVDLYQGGQLFGWCSGSVIAPQVVLTAGHCVADIDSWQVRSSCPLFQSQPRTPRLLLPVVMPVKAAPAGCTSEQQLCG